MAFIRGRKITGVVQCPHERGFAYAACADDGNQSGHYARGSTLAVSDWRNSPPAGKITAANISAPPIGVTAKKDGERPERRGRNGDEQNANESIHLINRPAINALRGARLGMWMYSLSF